MEQTKRRRNVKAKTCPKCGTVHMTYQSWCPQCMSNINNEAQKRARRALHWCIDHGIDFEAG